MAKKKKKKNRELTEAEMDMTAMIDVTFLLLIFFLCLEFKTLEGKLAANLPKDVGVNTTEAIPVENLDVRIECIDWGEEVLADKRFPYSMGGRFKLVGHKVKWWIGAKSVTTTDELQRKLNEASEKKIINSKGQKEQMPIVIKTAKGVTYGDVTVVIDMARNANFRKITFGGGEGFRKKPPGAKKK